MTVEPDTLSTTFAALADPTRRAMLARLAQGEATVTELAAPFDMSLPGTRHAVLQRAGLIEQGRQAQWRPCRPAGALREVAGSSSTDGIGKRASTGWATTRSCRTA
jgi:DNA-binding transcriptional ArsR family regulator